MPPQSTRNEDHDEPHHDRTKKNVLPEEDDFKSDHNQQTSLSPEENGAGSDHALLALEDYCAEPEFTSGIFAFFAQEHAGKLDDRQEDFPHEWYVAWKEYKDMIERRLVQPIPAGG